MSPWVVPAAAFGGALSGPVLRSLIFRYSVRSGEPPRYDCPDCGHRLVGTGWRRMAGALPATGRCPECRRRVGPPAAAVEMTAAVVVALLAWRVGDFLPWLAFTWLFGIGVALVYIDLAVHRLPDALTLPAAAGAAGLLALAGTGGAGTGGADAGGVAAGGGRLAVALACAVGVAAFYALLVLANPSGMGLGDAKAALGTGLVTGWIGLFAAVSGAAGALVLGGLCALVLLVAGRVRLSDQIPHGPFLFLGALTAVALLA